MNNLNTDETLRGEGPAKEALDTSRELLAEIARLKAENKKLKARPKKARAPTPKREAPPREPKAPVPAMFEGLTLESCCDDCVANAGKAVEAQKRLNEIDSSYPRLPARDLPVYDERGTLICHRRAPTVMEDDAEWSQRVGRQHPEVVKEFFERSAQVLGHCVIQGGPGCAHPCKGGLSPAKKADPVAVQRFNRAKRLLKLEQLNSKL